MRAQHRGTRWCVAVLAAVTFVVCAAVPVAAASPAAPTPTPSSGVTASTTSASGSALRWTDPHLTSPGGLSAGITHPDVWWTFDAQAAHTRLIALDSRGRTVATYLLQGVTHWNALTVVKSGSAAELVLADLTKGQSEAGLVTLYRVDEPAHLGTGTLAVKSYRLKYPDGGHDAATLLASPSDGRLYIVSRSTVAAAVFALPGALGPEVNKLTRLRKLPFGVRAGTFTPDGRVVLRTAADIRIMNTIRDPELAGTIKTSRAVGDAIGAAADGRSVIVADKGQRSARTVRLPASKGKTPLAGATTPVSDNGSSPFDFTGGPSGPPGGMLGTGALIGLVVLGMLGGLLYVRGRRTAPGGARAAARQSTRGRRRRR
ncbi:hypothetical protein J4573_07845 [Actinomadura barringtoniae]|uniref:WD40 repeat domain-containing protein n=1 Tax=Actinomadura barringtoniae TaxID=1427535 RepID=A0A939P7I8_9ACTN|nr:hypothetical protein [Actinomadura barringtoniae]MBO2446998.1 hypothetical protein [Actinomadura barringtoniae]